MDISNIFNSKADRMIISPCMLVTLLQQLGNWLSVFRFPLFLCVCVCVCVCVYTRIGIYIFSSVCCMVVYISCVQINFCLIRVKPLLSSEESKLHNEALDFPVYL